MKKTVKIVKEHSYKNIAMSLQILGVACCSLTGDLVRKIYLGEDLTKVDFSFCYYMFVLGVLFFGLPCLVCLRIDQAINKKGGK